MARETTTQQTSMLADFFQVGLYKRTQGKVVRQVTFAVLALTAAIAAWRLSVFFFGGEPWLAYGLPGFVLVAGLWFAYRIVNLPSFADFLISVEGEMAKVSWPDRTQLVKSTAVVIITVFLLAAVLFTYDLVWKYLLRAIGVI